MLVFEKQLLSQISNKQCFTNTNVIALFYQRLNTTTLLTQPGKFSHPQMLPANDSTIDCFSEPFKEHSELKRKEVLFLTQLNLLNVIRLIFQKYV